MAVANWSVGANYKLKTKKTYVTVNSSVVPEAVTVLTYVSSSVIVTGAEMISVNVAVAVGATVLKMVTKPVEEATIVCEGPPPDGSITMVPGRPVTLTVMSPSPAVIVMILPPSVEEDEGGVAVVASEEVAEAVTFPEAIAVPVTSADVAEAVAFPEEVAVAATESAPV